MFLQATSPMLLVLMSFLTSGALILLAKPVCFRLNHLDHPGGRKRHRLGTPLCGGVVIALTLLLYGAFTDRSLEFIGFAFGATLLAGLGVVDDRRHVPAVVRLGIQVIAVAIGMCAISGLRLYTLGDLFGTGNLVLHGWSVALTIFASVGVINAVNMIDGVDGIAGGFSLLVLLVLYALAAPTGGINLGVASILIGSLLGFLAFNLRTPWQKSARIFLGDAGSLMLGYVLVWFAISASQGTGAVMSPITAVWLMGLPLCDTSYLMFTRAIRGRNPMTADRFHYHHLLLRLGLRPMQAFAAWLGTSALFIATGVVLNLSGSPENWATYLFFLFFVVYCLAVSAVWRWLLVGRRNRKQQRSA